MLHTPPRPPQKKNRLPIVQLLTSTQPNKKRKQNAHFQAHIKHTLPDWDWQTTELFHWTNNRQYIYIYITGPLNKDSSLIECDRRGDRNLQMYNRRGQT